jgi:sugar/nucleoside kinase (ribokinase family)
VPSPLVVAVGLATVDLVQRVPELPGPGDKLESGGLELSAGGPAANAAVTVAALGGRARLVTVLGRHPLAGLAADDLVAHGVELHDLRPGRSEPPPLSAIVVRERDGERTVVSPNAAGVRLGPADVAGVPGLGEAAAALLLDGHHPAAALAAARSARDRGVPVLLDAGSGRPVLDELLPLVDVCACSQRFAAPRPPEAYGVPIVIRTQGPDPVRFAGEGVRGEVAVPAVPAVDTAGAGDVWHGAFAVELARLRRLPSGDELPGLIAAATAVAARRVRHAGARTWLRAPGG